MHIDTFVMIYRLRVNYKAVPGGHQQHIVILVMTSQVPGKNPPSGIEFRLPCFMHYVPIAITTNAKAALFRNDVLQMGL